MFIHKIPFVFVEVCGKPQSHGLLQRTAAAGVWRGAIAAKTQVTLPLQEARHAMQCGAASETFGCGQLPFGRN